jgi:type VI secretion system secreted protein Hcp
MIIFNLFNALSPAKSILISLIARNLKSKKSTFKQIAKMKKKLIIIVLFPLLIALNSNAQQNARPAAISMILQIGGSAPSNLGGGMAFPGLMNVLAWSENISSNCTATNVCATPNQQDLSITLYQEDDYILMRQALLNNVLLNLELTNTGSSPASVSKIYLESARIASISTGGSGGEDKLTMNVTFSAPKWDHYYIPAVGPSIHYGWNFITNTPFSHY